MDFEVGDIIQWEWDEGGRLNPILVLGDGIDCQHYLALNLEDGSITDSDWNKGNESGVWRKLA